MATNLGDNVFIDVEPDEFQLSWTRFHKVPASTNGMDAQTSTDAAPPSFTVAVSGTDVVVTRVQGRVALNRTHCWVVSGRETNQLLEHEQGHYYITYIPYVLALQAIRALTVPLARVHIPHGATQHVRDRLMHNAITLQARGVLSRSQTTMTRLTREYDARQPPGTDHSRNQPEQQRWNQRFATSLTMGTAL
jgi:hypothetical protein